MCYQRGYFYQINSCNATHEIHYCLMLLLSNPDFMIDLVANFNDHALSFYDQLIYTTPSVKDHHPGLF